MSGPSQNQTAALAARAIEAMQKGQWSLAERAVGQIYRLNRRDPEGLQLLGILRARQGRTQEAEGLFRRSLALRPNQVNVQVNLAGLLASTGRMEDGIALLRAAIRVSPNKPDLYFMLGQLQQNAGDMEFAEKNLRNGLKLRPDDLPGTVSLSGLLNMTERPALAEEILRGALARDIPPGARVALEHNLAVSLKMQERYEEALTLFDSALARAPDMPLAAANRASVLRRLGRDDEAIAGYRAELARDPLQVMAHQELNELLLRKGLDAEFLRSFEVALARVPDHPELLRAKADLLTRAGRIEEAGQCLERASSAQAG